MQQGIKEKDIRDFIKCAERLKTIIKRIREYKPQANLYVSDGELNLLSDESHVESGVAIHSNTDAVVESVYIEGLDGGGW